MAARPRLLFLCHTLPYPPDGGVWIRSFYLLRELSRRFDVTALCFERSGTSRHDVDAAIEGLSEMARTEAFPVPQDASALRKLLDHAASLFSNRVFTVYKHRSDEYRARLTELLAGEQFDLIHVDSLDLSDYLPLLKGAPVVCGHHNIESELLERRAKAEDNSVLSWYVGHQASLQREEEERWCPEVDLNVVVSPEDRESLTEIAPEADVEVVPNGVDVEKFTPNTDRSEEEGIVFVGGGGWFPNRDGMRYFASEILPRIRERWREPLPVTWVGACDDDTRRYFEDHHSIRLTGYVEDIRPHVRAHACFVVPLRVGGGSRLKILDAWALGKAVVSTSQGCEGLKARDGENIIVRDEPESFADAVVRVLSEAELRNRLGRAARATAVEAYSWEQIGTEMLDLYQGVIEREARSA